MYTLRLEILLALYKSSRGGLWVNVEFHIELCEAGSLFLGLHFAEDEKSNV